MGKHTGKKPGQAGSKEKPASSPKKHAGSAGSKDGQASVQRVLDRFARALTAGDGEAVADLWETPAFVIGSGMARAVLARDEVVEFFSGGKDQYNSRGITDTRAEIQRLDWVAKDLVVADVRWPYLTANGEEVGEETSTYTLLRDGDGELKIRSVLMRGAAE
jgi:hypothetical protein